ncbi:Fluconazole resistance protein 1 [Spathaspora sp. JA1]|nr:Fluconazole resistance protein 1 [Spathaspora sp. JA1]
MHSHQEDSHIKKKRVGKACDSCRIKKTKCDGRKPCNRCIIDNKICVFTEKKKLKEKNHPTGYVELLETRLDVLTKSFEKLIELSQPHLKFIQDIVEEKKKQLREIDDVSSMEEGDDDIYDEDGNRTVADEDAVPINKVVAYLIQQQGLLQNLPMEWEEGALIAADFDRSKNLSKYAKLFAEHKANGSPVLAPVIKKEHQSPNVSPRLNASIHSSRGGRLSDERVNNNNIYNSPLVDHSDLVLNSRQQEFVSPDFESDANSNTMQNINGMYRGSESPSAVNEFQSGPYRTASLFSNDAPLLTKTASLTSLTNTYDSHSIASPPLAPIQLAMSPMSSPVLLGKPLPTTISQATRRYSNNGIHKPQHQSHHHHHIHKPDYTKRDSGSSTTSSMIATPNQSLFSPIEEPTLNNYLDEKVFSMNAQPVIASPPEVTFGQYQSFDILVTENNFDTFMNNGQF